MPERPPREGSVTATGCQVCATPLAGRADQRFCSPTCRQTAHRRRGGTPTALTPVLPAGASRRDRTIYECDDCGERLIGQQWCHDCQRSCRRLDFGGGDAVTIADLVSRR